MTAENIGKPPVRVRHSELERASSESMFRSWCPVCQKGLLLVGRDQETLELTRVDRCTTCGQLFVYEDADIEGVEFGQTLSDLGSLLSSEGWGTGCKLCGKGLVALGAFCSAGCCARWEAGERPKWPSRYERMLKGALR